MEWSLSERPNEKKEKRTAAAALSLDFLSGRIFAAATAASKDKGGQIVKDKWSQGDSPFLEAETWSLIRALRPTTLAYEEGFSNAEFLDKKSSRAE